MRLMCVEDNTTNVNLYKRIALARKYEFSFYTSAEAALLDFNKIDPHVVIVDANLDGNMSGMEMARIVRAKRKSIGIIVITAYSSEEPDCAKIGCDAFFLKPLPVTELYHLLLDFEERVR